LARNVTIWGALRDIALEHILQRKREEEGKSCDLASTMQLCSLFSFEFPKRASSKMK